MSKSVEKRLAIQKQKMVKIVYNACYGGASLSNKAIKRYAEIKGNTSHKYEDYEILINRTDPVLVRVIEELGREANGRFADLRIQKLPEGTQYRIDQYDGSETIMTPDDYHWEIA